VLARTESTNSGVYFLTGNDPETGNPALYEEILVFEYCYATHGTLGYGGVRVLTRVSSNGNLEEMKDVL
jgi:hypothetical protein